MKLLRAIFRRFGYALYPLDIELIILTIPKTWTGTIIVEPDTVTTKDRQP